MLKPLILKKSQLTPEVILDKNKNIFFIEGKSIYSNGRDFYNPILEWFKKYFENPNSNTELTIYFQYINSSSFFHISMLIDLFMDNSKKTNLKIIWKYDADDEIIQENGEEFKKNVNFDFEIVAVS